MSDIKHPPTRLPHRQKKKMMKTPLKQIRKPPTVEELCEIPFKEMEYAVKVTAEPINAAAFEQDVLALLQKYNMIANPESLTSLMGRKLSIAFPQSVKDRLHIDMQHTLASGINEYTSFINVEGKTTHSFVRYPAYYDIRPELQEIRRTFTVASQYEPKDTVSPTQYDAIQAKVVVEKNKPTVIKSYFIDDEEFEYVHAVLPADKYEVLNKR